MHTTINIAAVHEVLVHKGGSLPRVGHAERREASRVLLRSARSFAALRMP